MLKSSKSTAQSAAQLNTELAQILKQITALSDMPERSILKRLIDALRVTDNDSKQANANIDAFMKLLRQHPEYAAGLAAFILQLVNQHQETNLYTDIGILSDQGFFHNLNRLIGHRFLPILPEDKSIVELIDYLFDQRQDTRWLSSVDSKKWDELVDLIEVDDHHLNLVATAKNNILNAIVILSYRISGIGLHPDLMQAYPQVLNYSAAFVAQNQEAVLFVNQYRKAHELDAMTDVTPEHDIDPAPLLVMLDQCEDFVAHIRKRIYKTGISIRLTNMLLRLEQSIHRMRVLTELVSDNHHDRDKAVIELTQTYIQTAKKRYSIAFLIDTNTKLLSRKVTENASRVGEHYISTDKSGYKKMLKKAALGGFVIAFMATIKILAYGLQLAPIGSAFVNSMIYGLGFVFIHIIHGTVATKQPAMTAAAIASTISSSTGKATHKLTKLSELIVDILRTQYIAIIGNVMVAMPMAYAISYAWLQYYGTPMIHAKKAASLLHELDPFMSLALPHAAIAGVFLFLSGLIAGYYDNLAMYNNIGERIRRHWLLLKLMPKQWVQRFGSFIEANLGAIMGNFLFGVFLGSTATVGFILGLPLDIRHIAFASANFAHGTFNLPAHDLTLQIILISLLGVALIGLINLMVSFSLALLVALRSKDVHFVEWRKLARLLFNHLTTHPLDFIWPRPEPMKYARIDSQGQMIFDDNINKGTAPKPQTSAHYVIRRLSDHKKTNKGKAQADNKSSKQSQHDITQRAAIAPVPYLASSVGQPAAVSAAGAHQQQPHSSDEQTAAEQDTHAPVHAAVAAKNTDDKNGDDSSSHTASNNTANSDSSNTTAANSETQPPPHPETPHDAILSRQSETHSDNRAEGDEDDHAILKDTNHTLPRPDKPPNLPD